MAKKVIIVLVEGCSDEALLIERMDALYKEFEIRFEVQKRDVFYNNQSRRQSIKLVVGDIVQKIIKKRKYLDSDILAVLHITDTDGCLIPNDCIKIEHKQKEPTYYSYDSIKVNSNEQQQNIIERNKIKSENVKTMNKQQKVVSKKYMYQLYYFSRNLEHVIFDEPNPKKNRKCENIEEFLKNLECTVEEFLKGYLPYADALDYSEKYKKSWNYIEECTNSLKRSTNVPLLFEFINKNINK